MALTRSSKSPGIKEMLKVKPDRSLPLQRIYSTYHRAVSTVYRLVCQRCGHEALASAILIRPRSPRPSNWSASGLKSSQHSRQAECVKAWWKASKDVRKERWCTRVTVTGEMFASLIELTEYVRIAEYQAQSKVMSDRIRGRPSHLFSYRAHSPDHPWSNLIRIWIIIIIIIRSWSPTQPRLVISFLKMKLWSLN